MERAHYLGGGVGVQSPFDAIAVQTVTLLAMHESFKMCGAFSATKPVTKPLETE